MEILKIIKRNVWILLASAILLLIDIRFFLFFLFICIVWMFDNFHTYIHAIIWNLNNNKFKLRALMRKMQITDKDIEIITEEAKSELSAEDFTNLDDDIIKDVKKF